MTGRARPAQGGAPRRGRLTPLAVTLLAVALVGAAAGRPAEAQEVRFPRPETAAQRELARFLAEEDYEIWTQDTVLARDATAPGHVVVLEGAARIAGRIEGSIYVADGDLLLRPGASIRGDVLVIGGGYYSSGLAEVEGSITYRPNERLRVLPEEGDFLVFVPVEERPALDLGPAYGLRFPVRQRVDNFVLGWGGTARARRTPLRPELEGEVRYRTEPERLDGSVRVHAHPARTLRITAGAGRSTRSNDAWIRSQLLNTASFVLVGNDYRDYYRADHASLFAQLTAGGGWTFSAGGQWEDARSLAAADRTGLFDSDEARPNPSVDDGETISLAAGVDFRRRAGASRTRFLLELEAASDEVAGDFSFLRGEVRGGLRRVLPTGHAVELFSIARSDLAGSLPRQRWSGLGGIGTIPTFPILSIRGPRMFLGEVTYLVPIPRLEVPQIGPTELFVRGVAGSAWGEGERPRVEQNLMAGVRFLFLEAALAWDPAGRERDLLFFVTGRFPRG